MVMFIAGLQSNFSYLATLSKVYIIALSCFSPQNSTISPPRFCFVSARIPRWLEAVLTHSNGCKTCATIWPPWLTHTPQKRYTAGNSRSSLVQKLNTGTVKKMIWFVGIFWDFHLYPFALCSIVFQKSRNLTPVTRVFINRTGCCLSASHGPTGVDVSPHHRSRFCTSTFCNTSSFVLLKLSSVRHPSRTPRISLHDWTKRRICVGPFRTRNKHWDDILPNNMHFVNKELLTDLKTVWYCSEIWAW